MEYKKKTLIWEDNNEPPKNYIWIKSDGKPYEYDYSQNGWIESKSFSTSSKSYTLPVASDTTLGGVKIGEGLSIDQEGILSVYNADSNVQIVELTYDHLPATGTLSSSDLEKLDGDNCLLIINGKYFRKTFGSNSGFDYKEIGITSILGGLRSIYFTVSKPDGEYTIAYSHPIEANTQTQATTTLENIKVGNTTFSVPISPMIVTGTMDGNYFSPINNSPTWTEARAHMFAGGLVYLFLLYNGEPFGVFLATFVSDSSGTIGASADDGFIFWNAPESGDINIS